MRVLFFNESLNMVISAIERVTMQRALLFKKYFNLDVDFLTITHNARQEEIRQHYIQKQMLHPNNKIFNMFDYFQEIDRTTLAPSPTSLLYDPTNTSLQVVQEDQATRVRQGKWLLMFIKYDTSGRVVYVNHYKDNKIIRCDTYDELGFLNKTAIINKQSKIISNLLYRPDGTLAVQQYYEIIKDKSELQYMHTLDTSGRYVHTVYSMDELVSLWVKHVLLDDVQNSFCLIERNLNYKKFFISTPLEQLHHIYSVQVLHTIHFSYGVDKYSKASVLYDSFINKQCTHNALVALTDQQNADVSERVGASNVYTIPHVAPKIRTRKISTKRNMSLVYVARLVPVKQHNIALDIFKRVVEKVPDAQLHIYGRGSEEATVRDTIKMLGLEKSVILQGYTDDVHSVFQNACLSILTSLFEAFSVSLLESLANGCPAVSFDVLYGPSDLIVHGKNGYLVPPGDNAAFAEHIVRILQDTTLRQILSTNAVRHVHEHFREEVVAGKWKQLLDDATQTLRFSCPAGSC